MELPLNLPVISGAIWRRILLATFGLAIAILGGIVGLEIWYRTLLPSPLPEAPPLPRLARAALWAEFGGDLGAKFPVSFPFLVPAVVAAIMAGTDVDTRRRPSNGGVLNQLAKTHLFVLQGEGKVSPRLRHLSFAVRELAIATWVSRNGSPTQAIDAYGARAWMGHDRRGLRAGATLYFGRPLESLDVGDMALLVAITRSPHRLDPGCFPGRAMAERNGVLGRMAESGVLDSDVAARAAAAPLAAKLDCNRI